MRYFLRWLRRVRWLPALLLAVAVLAPYYNLLVGTAIPIPDDIFVSDLADGEFPGRVEAGRLVRAGEAPLWTPRLFTGTPMIVDALSYALFTALPPALALGWFLGLLLLTAALGAYALAQQLGASRSGAFLAGFSYAWSGFFVCQLRHLAVLGTVAFFPLALFCLERAASGGVSDLADARDVPLRRRLLWLTGFGALFGLQVLAAFPQSAYISALVYAALVAARSLWLLASADRKIPMPRRLAPAAALAVGALAAVLVGALVGMVTLLPLRELGALSDRSGGGTFEWATQFNYWPRNFLTFFVPYANGDISNLTYQGRSIFWEDYGYVGLATVLLAFVAVLARPKRFSVVFWALTGAVAYLLVLGKATPFYRLAWELLPGLATFRFPTRFLFVVELALALLGGLGLTFIQEFIARRLAARKLHSLPSVVAALLVSLTVVDLVYHNRRQNPLADADRWLAPPGSASIIRSSGEEGRVYAPGSMQRHVETFHASGGWSGDLNLFYAHREFLQPNSNLLHGIATVDGYAGISPRWVVDLIGDHNRQGLLGQLYQIGPYGLRTAPAFFDWLEALSVRWLILPFRAYMDRVQYVGSAPPAEVYRLPGALPRARVVARARIVPSKEDVWRLILAGQLDPRREVLLHEASVAPLVASMPGDAVDGSPAGEARIVVDRATEVVVEASAPRGGLLLLADTFYPGWEARVDGQPTPILRANVAHRAVPLSPGSHRVAFAFRSRSVFVGAVLSGTGVALLAVAALGLAFLPRRDGGGA